MTVAPPVERQPDDAVAAVQNVGSPAAEDESGRGALIPSPLVALAFLLVGCLALLLTISAPGLRARMRPARLDDGVKKNRA
jgi:hypothetical protein